MSNKLLKRLRELLHFQCPNEVDIKIDKKISAI